MYMLDITVKLVHVKPADSTMKYYVLNQSIV